MSTPRQSSIAMLLLLLGAGSVIAATPAAAAPNESLRETVIDVEPAIVAVLAIYENGSANQGTGFIVRPDGLVVTCNHVIENATSVEIHWSKHLGRPVETATVLARDPQIDLAILQLSGRDYPTIPLATLTEIRVGDSVAALGFPVGDVLGLTDLTVTRGVISALRSDANGVVELVQTDAPIAVGHSGGPLFDLDLGAVVGVLRAKGLEELDGINFAAALQSLVTTFPEVTDPSLPILAQVPDAAMAPTAVEHETVAPSLLEPIEWSQLARYV
ncbi:MAG: serine protease, partial [bacterium]